MGSDIIGTLIPTDYQWQVLQQYIALLDVSVTATLAAQNLLFGTSALFISLPSASFLVSVSPNSFCPCGISYGVNDCVSNAYLGA